jgi:hypothetical protein
MHNLRAHSPGTPPKPHNQLNFFNKVIQTNKKWRKRRRKKFSIETGKSLNLRLRKKNKQKCGKSFCCFFFVRSYLCVTQNNLMNCSLQTIARPRHTLVVDDVVVVAPAAGDTHWGRVGEEKMFKAKVLGCVFFLAKGNKYVIKA